MRVKLIITVIGLMLFICGTIFCSPACRAQPKSDLDISIEQWKQRWMHHSPADEETPPDDSCKDSLEDPIKNPLKKLVEEPIIGPIENPQEENPQLADSKKSSEENPSKENVSEKHSSSSSDDQLPKNSDEDSSDSGSADASPDPTTKLSTEGSPRTASESVELPQQVTEEEPHVDVGPADVGPADVHPADVDPADLNPAGVGPADVHLADVEPSHVDPADVDPADDVSGAASDFVEVTEVFQDIPDNSSDALLMDCKDADGTVVAIKILKLCKLENDIHPCLSPLEILSILGEDISQIRNKQYDPLFDMNACIIHRNYSIVTQIEIPFESEIPLNYTPESSE